MPAYDAIRLEKSWHQPVRFDATLEGANVTAAVAQPLQPSVVERGIRAEEPSTLALGITAVAILALVRGWTRLRSPARIPALPVQRGIKPRRRAA